MLRSIYSTPLDPKWCLGVFRSILLTFGMKKDAKLDFEPERTISGYQSCEACILLHCNTRNPLIHDEILMTFCYFVIDHTASMTNGQISS
jgi:hypothetical protein